ncbi:MAG: lipoate--protein ligase [Eubacteriales bacterium]|nr:lipoate--protein ligase [Eubacteriales bacterium]
MKNKLYYFITDNHEPYKNIALEEYFLLNAPQDSIMLYLWQNERTVVIGRNQCAWRECNIEALQKDRGTLARRLSGGGAVYHDLGNVNFTFLYPKEVEDIKLQTSVIVDALANLGMEVSFSGRNDITYQGKKFSGNAFYTNGNRAYHHGTLMLDVDTDTMLKYLNVNQQKYLSKGVASVRSRVINLKSVVPEMTVESLNHTLISSFEKVYKGKAEEFPEQSIDKDSIASRLKTFSSWDWVYGRPINFNFAKEIRYTWGLVRVEAEITSGRIGDIGIFTDAMEPDLFASLEQKLKGARFDINEIKNIIDSESKLQQYSEDLIQVFV